MSGRKPRCAVPAAALACLVIAAAGGIDVSGWSHMARISRAAPGGSKPAGVVEVPLSPQVLQLAKVDLSDLRVVDENGGEIPYVVRTAETKTTLRALDVKLFNRVGEPGKLSSVVADFGGNILKNRIEVETPGRDFRRRTLVEGSDDGQHWKVVRNGEFIFSVAPSAAGPGFDKSTIALPDNNQRYLRLTVFNAPDDLETVPIEDVKAWQTVVEPPETVDLPIELVIAEVSEASGYMTPKKKATDIVIDLGYRNMRLHEVRLQFSEPNFFRRFELYGRDTRTAIEQTPEGPIPEIEIEAPWHGISRGVIYRFSTGGEAESLTLGMNGASYRYLQIRIHNGDDAPLTFGGVRVTRLQQYVDFPPAQTGDYTIYLGNRDAARPSYDIVHYIDRLRREGVGIARLGDAVLNPAYRVEAPPARWEERYRALIWIVLIAALAVLCLLVYREAKSARRSA